MLPGWEPHDDRRDIVRGRLLQGMLHKHMTCFLSILHVANEVHGLLIRRNIPQLMSNTKSALRHVDSSTGLMTYPIARYDEELVLATQFRLCCVW